MHSPTTVASTPEVVIGPDGVPRISPEYLDAYERFMQTIVTEDDTPVDNIFSAKQARLLIESLYTSWTHPRFGRRFIADGNVGVFYALRQPPLVPDVFLSLDVVLPADLLKKNHRSYFIWEYGKPPDVVVEIVSNTEGQEESIDGKLGKYARMRVMRYVVYDPWLLIGQEPLRIYALNDDRLERTNEAWFEQMNLGIVLWRGQFEGCEDTWLRWCDREGTVIPTGAERAEVERKRAEAERARAERLAARLRAAGIEPD